VVFWSWEAEAITTALAFCFSSPKSQIKAKKTAYGLAAYYSFVEPELHDQYNMGHKAPK